ncbi:hypothetical protein [Methylobacterium sp. J-092]|uniref:hypothetical protein n=1 Tax=Methylobacterium sp. J-092 TaxID=2836667 RepID=UPI001FBA98AE|nr:hypothetical protein [Methylobacterium sp. J-092]MCJ2009217.1 hypothetical protein [Methylobacterium sp. J-092]
MSQGKRTLPPEDLRAARRATADGAAPLIRQHYQETPDESFKDGVEARRTLDHFLREEDIGESLHGPDRVVRFPRHLIELFAALGRPETKTLLTLASLKAEEMDALLRIARREADRTVFGRVWGGAWKVGLGLALPTYAAAKWGWEQIPFLKQIIAAVKGTTG